MYKKSLTGDFSVQLCVLSVSVVCFCSGIYQPQRHREHGGCTEKRVILTFSAKPFLVLTFILPRRRTSTKLPGSSCVDTKVHQGALSVCTDCRNHAGARKRAYLRPHPRRFFVFIFLIFNSPFSCRAISRSAVSAIAQPLVRSIM